MLSTKQRISSAWGVDSQPEVTTRESLKSYDPGLYTLVDETMAYKERVDWRFKREARRD